MVINEDFVEVCVADVGVTGVDGKVADLGFIAEFFVIEIPRLLPPKILERFGGLPFEESLDTFSTSRSVNI